jgi:GNAT superfamily N-acetyltransferase
MTVRSPPFERSGIRYTVCDPSDVLEMSRLLADTFSRSDPPAVAVGLTAAEFEVFVRIVARPAGTQRLTIIARDIGSGEMAGALLAEDAAAPPPNGMDELSEKFEPIFDLFEELAARIPEAPEAKPGAVLHLFLLGTADRFAGRGIGQHLVGACLANGRGLGYRIAVVEATGRTSQHIASKFGFVARAQMAYADYRREGVAVFESLSEQGGPMAMILDMRSQA